MRAKRQLVWALSATCTLAGGAPARAAIERNEPPPDADADCGIEPVWVTRAFPGGESERAQLRLVDCDGAPNLAALDELSLLARPFHTPRPSPVAVAAFAEESGAEVAERFVAPDVMRLDPRLLPRLQALTERFPGRRIAIVSGYRPGARATSRHRHGRALDLRIGAVPRREVAEAARELAETGVGYYPNSVFTHVDVREEATHWCDYSRPGEPPRYGPWPSPDEPSTADEPDSVLAAVLERVRAAFAAEERTDEAPPRSADAVEPADLDGDGTGPTEVSAIVAAPAWAGAAPWVSPASPDAAATEEDEPAPPLSRGELDALLESIRDTVERSHALDVRLEHDPGEAPAPAAGDEARVSAAPR